MHLHALDRLESALKTLREMGAPKTASTDFEDLTRRARAFEQLGALGPDLVSALATVLESAAIDNQQHVAHISELRMRWGGVQGIHSRREAMVRAAAETCFGHQLRSGSDVLGPFHVTHDLEGTSLWLGQVGEVRDEKVRVASLRCPSGGEIVACAKERLAALENAAKRLTPRVVEQLRQPDASREFKNWKDDVLPWCRRWKVEGDPPPTLVCIFVLASMKARGLILHPAPVLAEQPMSVTVPNLRATGDGFRVYRIAVLDSIGASSAGAGVEP